MSFFKKIAAFFSRRPRVDWEDLEALLIQADLGPKFTMEIMDALRAKGRDVSGEDVADVTHEEILKLLPARSEPLRRPEKGPSVILITGVNGVGKTTSAAKLAYWLQQRGHRVLLAAADTFRAAAIEQLEAWAQRLNVPIVKTRYKADPASVCYEAHERALAEGFDFLICDTAGRLHTKHNLMEELGKIRRVLGRKDPSAPHETLIVVDATTGSNALAQAREFQKALQSLTGVIITKLDGSGKGGVAVSLLKELGLAPRFIGTGEGAEDFAEFEAKAFVDRIL